MMSLLDQLKNLLGEQIAALAAFGWAVGWATAQNFFDKLSAPSIVGPGKADILRYGMDILGAADSKSACKAAADGIYNLLLPNFGDAMGSYVSAVTDLTGVGDHIGNSVASTSFEGSDSTGPLAGGSDNFGEHAKDIFGEEVDHDEENQ